jgi:hypothetical protein
LKRFSTAYFETVINVVFARIDKAKRASDAQIRELEATIRELRAEVTVMREVLKGGNVRNMQSGTTAPKIVDIH